MKFRLVDDSEFQAKFMEVLKTPHKNNTYKFALARFLVTFPLSKVPYIVRQ